MFGIGARPGPIEHIFAIGMRLDIERAGSEQLAALRTLQPEQGKQRLPAGFGRGTATLLQRVQIGMLHEWGGRLLHGEQTIPGHGLDVCRIKHQLQLQTASGFCGDHALQTLQDAPGLCAIMDRIRTLRSLRRACVSPGSVVDV